MVAGGGRIYMKKTTEELIYRLCFAPRAKIHSYISAVDGRDPG